MNICNYLILLCLQFLLVITIRDGYAMDPARIVVTNEKGNFAAAQKYCLTKGMTVVRIQNEVENELVYNLAKKLGRYWVDGNNIAGGAYINSDKEKLTYFKWAGGQPDNWHGKEHCAEVGPFSNSLWNDIHCDIALGIVCLKHEDTPEEPEALDTARIVVTNVKGNFATAQKYCQTKGMTVLRIQNEAENELVYNLAKRLGRYWVDGNNIAGGAYINSDNEKLTYFKWAGGQPDNWHGKEHCAEVGPFGNSLWNDIHCDIVIGIVCLKGEDTPEEPEGLVANQVIVSNQKGTFLAAQAFCNSQGMSVIRIENDADNELVYNLAKRLGRYWLDGNNIAGGSYINSDNEKLTYFKWARGQPDNYQGKEHCAEAGPFGNSLWNDINCDTELGIVCLKDDSSPVAPVGIKPSQVIVTGKRGTFDAAQAHCDSLGLVVMRVEFEADSALVYMLAKKAGSYWLDGNNRAGSGWVNSDQQTLRYYKWGAGQPDNYKKEEHCIHVGPFNNDQWNDINCNSIQSIVCLSDTA